jgi:hypothetical protein
MIERVSESDTAEREGEFESVIFGKTVERERVRGEEFKEKRALVLVYIYAENSTISLLYSIFEPINLSPHRMMYAFCSFPPSFS